MLGGGGLALFPSARVVLDEGLVAELVAKLHVLRRIVGAVHEVFDFEAVARFARSAPSEGVDAGDEFRDDHGLHEAVVGTELQCLDAGLGLCVAGEGEGGRGDSVAAEAL